MKKLTKKTKYNDCWKWAWYSIELSYIGFRLKEFKSFKFISNKKIVIMKKLSNKQTKTLVGGGPILQ
ncbi:MAG: hypothetical protein IPO78_16700 [Saprospiraceae bacterium]|nr:hypothetical protein [Saprospiraceae bacterium]